jgi:superfamily II DNA or RNA helicase
MKDSNLDLNIHTEINRVGPLCDNQTYAAQIVKHTKPDYSFQIPLANEAYETMLKNAGVVLAAGCGAGKTNMAINIIDRYLLDFPKAKILVLTHGQNTLRTQFSDRLTDLKINKRSSRQLKFKELTPDDKKTFGKNNVLIALPQTLRASFKDKIDLLIVDEAHNFYSAPMVQTLIARCKPSHRLLLTGTPSIFVASKLFPIVSMASVDLLDYRVISDPRIKLIKSSYDWTIADYNEDGELSSKYRVQRKHTKLTLDALLEKIQEILVSRGSGETSNWKGAVDLMGKTIFACRGQRQANDVYKYLNRMKVRALVSTCDTDKYSEAIERFKDDKKAKVLVVANRGVLGLDVPSLANVIDMTGSHNPDRLYQLLSRVVRRHDSAPNKLFIKITPDSLAAYTYGVMCFTVALSTKRHLDTYDGKFKTKVFRVPKVYLESIKSFAKEGKLSSSRGLDWPPELPTFSSYNKYATGDFTEYGETTLSHVRSALYSHYAGRGFWTFENCKAEALKYSLRKKFQLGSPGAYEAATNMGQLDEVCAHMNTKKMTYHGHWSIEKCKSEALKHSRRKDFKSRSPSAYRAANENGWLDKVCAHMNTIRLPNGHWTFENCKAEALKYSYRKEFNNARGAAYITAKKKGWLDEICAHMKTRKTKPQGHWTFENCKAEALKYSSRKKFQLGSPGAFSAALKKGWYDEICAHMGPPQNSGKPKQSK